MNHVLIIGGGASGMVAAISARRAGAEVTILERNPRVGKKILATGNGRCNFTNINTDITCYHGNNPKFAYGALSAFSPYDAIDFFEKLGIAHKVEESGKVFPMSDQASSMLDVLLYEIDNLGINVVCNACVTRIIKKGGSFTTHLASGETYKSNRVIISTGGKAMPSSGSDGNGYDLASGLGHTVTKIFPALVQLKLLGSFFNRINGVKLVGTAEIISNNKPLARDRGDILFANYGVSGPPILQISRRAGELLNEGKKAYLKLSIVDTLPLGELQNLVAGRFQASAGKSVDFSLVGFINKRLIPVILSEAGVTNIKQPASALTAKEINSIAGILTDWQFEIRGTRSWPSAQVTAGGVNTDEINPKTMESKLVGGLYFCGEIVDIDGQCGGYNLQWAWSSGFITGACAAI